MNNLGEIIKEIRTKKNISRIEFAEKIHVSYSAIQHWENNRRDINLYYLKNICEVLNMEVIINNNYLKITDKDLNNSYKIMYEENNNYNFFYKVDDYGIIEFTKEDKLIYSIVHINALTTPYSLKLEYESFVEAKLELEKYLRDIKFPLISKHTNDTSGKIVFVEQAVKIFSELGYEQPFDEVRNIAKRKIKNINNFFSLSKSLYGEKDGEVFASILLNGIVNGHKRVLFNDYVRGYEAFLQGVTKITNGELRSIHQKHALLTLIDSNRSINDSFLGGYKEYDEAINKIIEKDIFKYGYPNFYKAVKLSIKKAENSLKEIKK